MTARWTTHGSPLGTLVLAGEGGALTAIELPAAARPNARHNLDVATRDDRAFDVVRSQLDEYFAGTRTVFDLPLRPFGTPFRQRVWHELSKIPYGRTVTYLHIARALGDPNATRAVGAANGANPLPIVIPCHRVIGSSGTLVGFGGGLDAKSWLLDHEARSAPPEGLFGRAAVVAGL